MRRIALTQAKVNHKIRIVEIMGGANLQNKFMHMNIFKGKELIKVSHLGLQGPIVIKSGRTILALGHSIASKVMVEYI
jgi:Fe2+ transport system protein FeoA